MRKFDYLIIGNSAAAVGAIESIRGVDTEGSIAVVSDEEHHVYSRPKISDCVTLKASSESIAYRPLNFYERFNVTPILGLKAVSLDTTGKIIRLESGEDVGYGKLLLATGALPAKPPIPGIDLLGVHYFVTFEQAQRLTEQIDGAQEIVVIGGGLIGMQAAEALCKIGKRVTVVEMLDRVLALSVDEHASSLIESKFEANGVKVLTSSRVKNIEGDESGVTGVRLSDDVLIPCQALVMAAGVTPRTELAVSAGIQVRRGIVVDDLMQTSAPDVYAAGDVAETLDLLSGENRLIPIWPNAYMEGRAAGFAMAGSPKPYAGGLSMNSAHFFEFPVIAAGALTKCNECTEIVDSNEKNGYYRRIILRENSVIGMVMAGDAVDRGGVVLSLIRNRTDVSTFIDKLADPAFNIAQLPKGLRETKQLGKERV